MRVIFQAFAALLMVSLAVGSGFMMKINWDWVARIADMRGDIVARFFVDGARADIPDADAMGMAAWIWMGLGIASLAAVVLVFIRRHRVAIVAAVVLIAFTVATVLLQPAVMNTKHNDPKTTAMGFALFGIIGLLVVILLHTTMKSDPEKKEMARLY